MRTGVCALIRITSVGLVAALLMMTPARAAHAQSNSAVAPSSSSAAANAPSGSEIGKSAETGNTQAQTDHHKAAHPRPKKKKTSFMHKMRDKAMEKVQKLFGKKQEPQPQVKQVPKQDIE